MQALRTCCNPDSKSFQRLHLLSAGVTLMPHEPDASLLFDHQDLPSEMTAPGREQIRNETRLKEEDQCVLNSPPALMLWVSQLGSSLGARAAEVGQHPNTKELRDTFWFLLPTPNPRESLPFSWEFVTPLSCGFPCHRPSPAASTGVLWFFSECFRCPLPFSRFQPGGNHPRLFLTQQDLKGFVLTSYISHLPLSIP